MSLPSACTKIYKNTVMTQLKRCQLSLKVPSLYSRQCNIGKNHFIETKQFFPPFLNQVQTRREIQGFFGIMGTKHQTFFLIFAKKIVHTRKFSGATFSLVPRVLNPYCTSLSNIRLSIRTFQGHSFPDCRSRGTKTLGRR